MWLWRNQGRNGVGIRVGRVKAEANRMLVGRAKTRKKGKTIHEDRAKTRKNRITILGGRQGEI